MKILSSVKSFYEKCKRVWMVLKKPTKDELVKVAQISALGIVVVGTLGFIISIIMSFFT